MHIILTNIYGPMLPSDWLISHLKVFLLACLVISVKSLQKFWAKFRFSLCLDKDSIEIQLQTCEKTRQDIRGVKQLQLHGLKQIPASKKIGTSRTMAHR